MADESDDVDDIVVVGRIGPARGLHGDLFVQPLTDAPDERFAAGTVLITEPAAVGPLTVESSTRGGGKQVVHFVGVDDRPGAEALRGTQLLVRVSERPTLDDPDEFYDTDLIGLVAHTVGGEDLGPIQDVVHAGAAAYLVVRIDGREHLIPFVSALVPAVDLTARTVTVDPPGGLFGL